MAHGPQEARDLAPMVSRMIYDMQQDLPQRRLVRVALQIFIRDLGQDILVSERGGPVVPALLESRPLFLEHVEAPVLIVDETCRWIPLDATQPGPVSGKSMREGARDGLVRSLEITAKLFCGEF